jgi:N-acetylglucosamine kinase-like BadF-type ATPase
MERVLSTLEIASMDDLMHRVYVVGLSRAELAALGPLTLAAATEGDRAARDALDEGARELARCVRAVARRLSFDAGPCELALSGGLFNAGALVTASLHAEIGRLLPGCRVLPAEQSPAAGAALLARRHR